MSKTEEILALIERYRFMTQSQIMRKLWDRADRQAYKNLNKYFKKSVVEALVNEGRLFAEEVDGEPAYSTHHSRIRKHEVLITEQVLRLEARARHRGFGFDFCFPRFDDISLRPDGAIKFTDTGRLLLSFLEVHLETESEPVLKEKMGRYILLAEEHVFQKEIDSFIREGFIPKPKTLGFKVLLFSYKKRDFGDRRFVSLLLEVCLLTIRRRTQRRNMELTLRGRYSWTTMTV